MTEPNGESEPSLLGGPGGPGSTPPPVVGPETDPALEFARIQRRNLRVVAGVVVGLIVMVIIGGFTYRTPYVALIPGSARDTEPLVEVSGVEEYPSEGELLFTTVRLRSRPNLWNYLWLTADDDARIVPEEVIYGDRTADENREVNLQAMTDSKELAVAVALEELGYEAITPDGVFVASVVDGTAADGVLRVGDVIVAIDEVAVVTDTELVALLGSYDPDDRILLSVERFGQSEAEDVVVVLGARDDDPTAAFLGIGPQTRFDLIDDYPFDVEIDSGSVGGPSAGLAFTLAVLDQLTPGELTGGAQVAVTGTITVDGRVGSVGGVPQKAAAVRDLGVRVFIVPAAIGEEAIAEVRERAGDDLEIIPVSTLGEALAALQKLGGDTGAVEEFAAGNL